MTDTAPPVSSIQSPILQQGRVRHGFYTRQGGVSGGIYSTLNCGPGSDDDDTCVTENHRRVGLHLSGSGAPLVTLYQVHSADVVRVDAPFPTDQRPKADGMVTDRPGIILGILTADCAPVLFADPDAGVIGAAHAGWKGAINGIIEATVHAMEGLGAVPSRIRAAIGPAISQASYEVSEQFRNTFVKAAPPLDRFFKEGARPHHWQFDLEGYVRAQLDAAAVGRIDPLGRDTYSEEDLFFSYRRTTHRHEKDYGRQVSAIMIDHD